MRSLNTSLIVYASGAEATGAGSQRRFLASSNAEDLEAGLIAQMAEFADTEGTWRLSHLELAGAGDGHTFTLWSEWVDIEALDASAGLSPTSATAVFFQGASAQALVLARIEAQRRYALLITDDDNGTELQTGLAGAPKGRAYMGFMIGNMVSA